MLIVFVVILFVRRAVLKARKRRIAFVIVRFRVRAAGRNFVESARGVGAKFVVRAFGDVAVDLLVDFSRRFVGAGAFVHRIRRKVRVRFPLRDGFARKRLEA